MATSTLVRNYNPHCFLVPYLLFVGWVGEGNLGCISVTISSYQWDF